VPCRRHRGPLCLNPFSSTWRFGFLGPWIFMAAAFILLAVGLVWDWHHRRVCFKHVTEPKEMIRSETQEQMAKREARQRTTTKTIEMETPKKPPPLPNPPVAKPMPIVPRGKPTWPAPPPPPPSAPPSGPMAAHQNGQVDPYMPHRRAPPPPSTRPTTSPPPPPPPTAPLPPSPPSQNRSFVSQMRSRWEK